MGYRFWRALTLLIISVVALMRPCNTFALDERAAMRAQRLGTGNPIAGKQKSAEARCQECHGVEGISSDEKIPNHAGQYANYLIKQLSNFQTGARKHDTMSIMAEDLNAKDMADIAAYFASLKPMQGEGGHDSPQALQLFLNGDSSRNIPACVSCHAANAAGQLTPEMVYPRLAGQRRVYLRNELVNWKLGERSNSPAGVMQQVAKTLSDAEIDALANYISGL